MKYPPDNAPVPGSASIDETLRLIAHIPVPEGLEQRVHAVVFSAAPRQNRILAWPVSAEPPAFWVGSGWMRTAAAAAIVFVVAGGGWGVYRSAERPVAKVIVIPAVQPAVSGGFSSAGAMRTPQTVKGPVVAQPAVSGTKPARKKGAGRRAAPAKASAPASTSAASAR